ncbi:MAG: SUMF1/EgtB/PvdO family nonheme iron enzyme, partial [Byssovorax sp.]
MIWMRLSLPVLALAWLAPALAFADAQASLDVDLGAGVKLALVLVPRGTFTQGSPPGEAGRSEDERAHPVTLGNDVYIGKFPVTRGQFARFVSATGYRTEAEKGTSGGSGWDGSALVQRRDFTWKSPGFAQTDEHPVT